MIKLLLISVIFFIFLPCKSLKVVKKNGKLQVEGYDDIDIGDDGRLKVNSYSITVRKSQKKKKNKKGADGYLDNFLLDNFLKKSNDVIPNGDFFSTSPLNRNMSLSNNNFPMFDISNAILIQTNIITNFKRKLNIETNGMVNLSNITVITNIFFITNRVTNNRKKNSINNFTNQKENQQPTNTIDKKNKKSKTNKTPTKELKEDEVISLILKAGKFKKQKRYGELVDLLNYLDEHTEKSSLRYRVKLMQGTVYYQLKLYEQAKKKWQESLQLKPNQPKLQAALKKLFFSKN